VTISGFRDRPLGKEAMLSYLVSQIQTLMVANATPIHDGATRYASATDRVTTVPVRPLSDGDLEDVVVAVARMPNGRLVPLPPRRPGALGRRDPVAEVASRTGRAGARIPAPRPSAAADVAAAPVADDAAPPPAAPVADVAAAPVDTAAPSADATAAAPGADETPAPGPDTAPEVAAATELDPAATDEPEVAAPDDDEPISTSRLAPRTAPPAPLRPGGG